MLMPPKYLATETVDPYGTLTNTERDKAVDKILKKDGYSDAQIDLIQDDEELFATHLSSPSRNSEVNTSILGWSAFHKLGGAYRDMSLSPLGTVALAGGKDAYREINDETIKTKLLTDLQKEAWYLPVLTEDFEERINKEL